MNFKISVELTKKIIEEVDANQFDSIVEAAFQLTAYESCGCFDFENFLLSQFREYYTLEASDYSEYAIEEARDAFYENDDETLDMLFSSPSEAIRAATYGDYRFSDDYVKFDGIDNLKSFNDFSEVYDEEAVIRYCIENQSHDEIDFIKDNQELIEEVARELVEQGY